MKDTNSTALTLDRLAAGARGVVKSVQARDRKLMQKLLAMGVVAGTAFEVVCVAPLGDPMEIRALGYRLSLRMSEAACVEVAQRNG